MMSQASEIDWRDITEAIPAFLTLMMIPFTFSITNGILFGLGSSFALYLMTGEGFKDARKFMRSPMSSFYSSAATQELTPNVSPLAAAAAAASAAAIAAKEKAERAAQEAILAAAAAEVAAELADTAAAALAVADVAQIDENPSFLSSAYSKRALLSDDLDL